MAAPVAAYIGLGSNLGDREANLAAARTKLAKLGRVAAESSLYETEPWGVDEPQPKYLNQAVCLVTESGPGELMSALLAIEAGMGRMRTRPGEPRVIDLDLLLYGGHQINAPGLTVPHPRMTQRAFVLAPLAEIAPGLAVPGTGQTVGQLAAGVSSRGVRRFAARPES